MNSNIFLINSDNKAKLSECYEQELLIRLSGIKLCFVEDFSWELHENIVV